MMISSVLLFFCGSVTGIAFSTIPALYMLVWSWYGDSHGISYSSVLNSQARQLKINKHKVAAEERRATFCPLSYTPHQNTSKLRQATTNHSNLPLRTA